MYFDFRRSFAQTVRETSAKKKLIRKPQPSAGGASDEKQTPGALVVSSGKASLLEAWFLHVGFVSRLQKRIPVSNQNQNYQNYSHGTMSRSYPGKTMHLYSVLMMLQNIQLSQTS